MSAVLRLQKKCLDKNESLQSLLREALLISSKLKLNDFKHWINSELKGYTENTPEYRTVPATLKFKNPYRGWIPAMIPEGLEDSLTISTLSDSVSALENLLTHTESNFISNLAPTQKKAIMELYNNEYEPALFISPTNVYGVLDTVRTVLLEWTLKLEEDNILGSDDLIFSEEEKEAAKSVHIEHFNGVMGNVDKVGNMSTGANSTNIYNENNISNEIDKLITEIKKLGLQNQEKIIIDLEESKNDSEKAKSVLGALLSRGAEVASISSAIISTLSLLG